MAPSAQAPLHGLRVVEMAGLAPAPFAGLLLSDFGADVVRIDRKGATSSDSLTRGKRSIALNLKDGKDLETVKALVAKADILIEGYRPGVMESLGLGPDVLCKANPRLIYARLTGFRRTGTWGKAAGHDINYLALSGALSALGPAMPEPPLPPGNLVADFAGGGLSCALGILLALQARTQSGKGTVVEQNMVDGVQYLSTFVRHAQQGPMWGEPRGNNILDGGCPYYSCYTTADGGFMAVGCLEPQFYKLFIEKLGVSTEIQQLDRFDKENWSTLRAAYSARFKEQSTAAWCKIYDGTDACVTPVLDTIEYAPVPVSVGGYAGLGRDRTHDAEGDEKIGMACGEDTDAVLSSWLGKAKL